MKNKLQLSNKISLRQQWLYASFGIGAIALVGTLMFVYLNLGNSEKAVAASYRYTSKDNQKGLWNNESTWNKNEAWLQDPRPILGTYFTASILGFVTYEPVNTADIFNANNGGTIDITDTLVINGNALFSSGKTINVEKNGVLVIFGDLTVSGGSKFSNKGRTVITGDLITPDGVTIKNNAVGNNNFYLFGERVIPSYNVGKNIIGEKNESQLQIIDPPLYDFVKNGGIILLPIVLDYFVADVTSFKSNLIRWGTVSEQDNDFFTLERSNDGKAFETIATIDGAGNSNQKIDYEFEDRNPLGGYNYYRLKQTDYNGDFEYFNIVVVNNENASKAPMGSEVLIIEEAYPNPFKNEINLSFEAQAEENIEVIIQDSRGDIVYSESVAIHHGATEYKFSKADKFAAGVYYISIKSNTQKYKPQRIVKL